MKTSQREVRKIYYVLAHNANRPFSRRAVYDQASVVSTVLTVAASIPNRNFHHTYYWTFM